MTRGVITCLLVLLTSVIHQFQGAGQAQSRKPHQTPTEEAIPPGLAQSVRSVLYSIYAGDAATYQRFIVSEPDSNNLLVTEHHTAQQLKELRREVDAIQPRQVSPFTVDGLELNPAGGSRYPRGAKAIYMTQFRDAILAIPVVSTVSGKVHVGNTPISAPYGPTISIAPHWAPVGCCSAE